MADVEAAAVRLRQLLPHIHVDTFVEAHPQVLEVADFELALEVSVAGADVAAAAAARRSRCCRLKCSGYFSPAVAGCWLWVYCSRCVSSSVAAAGGC